MARYPPQWLQNGSYAASQDRRIIGALWPAPASVGCIVSPGTGMQVALTAGQVAVPSSNNTGSVLCTSDAGETVTLPAAAPSLNRWDLIICRPRSTDLSTGSGDDFIFDSVQGTPASVPAPPAAPAGTVVLAQIYIPAGSASVSAGNINNMQPGGLSVASSVAPATAPRGYVASAFGPSTTVSCGATLTNVMALTANVVAGRRYRLSLFAYGTQTTAASATAFFTLTGSTNIDTPQNRFIQNSGQVAISSALVGSAVYTYTPAASGSQTWTIAGQTAAGTLSVGANQCFAVLEDMGSQ